MDRSRVVIVIPALNEAATIVNIVEAAGKFGLAVVVDDGSSDDTGLLALNAGATIVKHNSNQGYDAALNSGFKEASSLNCEVIITLDADGQHDPNILQKFIDHIFSGADVVVGARNRLQRVAEHLFAWYTRKHYGIRDPLCGMKAYRVGVYDALGHFDSYGSIGTELMLFAARNGYRISEIPFTVRDRQGSSRFGRVLSTNHRILRAMLLSFWRVK